MYEFNFKSENMIVYYVRLKFNYFCINFTLDSNPLRERMGWGWCPINKIPELDLNYLEFPKDLFDEIEKQYKKFKLKLIFQ